MKITPVLGACLALAAFPALAQTPAAAPAARARGPALTPSVQAAQAAVAACAAKGYKVTAEIVDSAGDPVVLLSGDGAALRTQTIVKTKLAVVMKYKITSGEVVAKAAADPAFAAELKADPNVVGTVYQGGLPLMADGQMIGAFAASGAPGGDKDEACVRAGLAASPLN